MKPLPKNVLNSIKATIEVCTDPTISNKEQRSCLKEEFLRYFQCWTLLQTAYGAHRIIASWKGVDGCSNFILDTCQLENSPTHMLLDGFSDLEISRVKLKLIDSRTEVFSPTSVRWNLRERSRKATSVNKSPTVRKIPSDTVAEAASRAALNARYPNLPKESLLIAAIQGRLDTVRAGTINTRINYLFDCSLTHKLKDSQQEELEGLLEYVRTAPDRFSDTSNEEESNTGSTNHTTNQSINQ
jgi:hypothetical protein